MSRTLLVEKQFRDICRMAEGVCRLVPLKGIDLATSFYGNSLERTVGDIDLLAYPEEGAVAFVRKLRAEGGYVPQFDYLDSEAALRVKRKTCLRPQPTALRTDVDIHLAFVTKKFFSRSQQAFNRDAVARLRHESGAVYRMDAVDRWLYLAQHAAFHHFSAPKWSKDLIDLGDAMTANELELLASRARVYNMERVCRYAVERLAGEAPRPWLSALRGAGRAPLWLRYLLKDGQGGRKWYHFIAKPFWEFVFIARRRDRWRAYFALFFPAPAMLCSIYRRRMTWHYACYYPMHALVSLIGAGLFALVYLAVALPKKENEGFGMGN